MMFSEKKSEEISGETCKLLSDTKVCVCILLKSPWVVFLLNIHYAIFHNSTNVVHTKRIAFPVYQELFTSTKL